MIRAVAFFLLSASVASAQLMAAATGGQVRPPSLGWMDVSTQMTVDFSDNSTREWSALRLKTIGSNGNPFSPTFGMYSNSACVRLWDDANASVIEIVPPGYPGDRSVWPTLGSDYTASMWLLRTNLPSENAFLLNMGNGDVADQGFNVTASGNLRAYSYRVGGGNDAVNGTGTITLHSWNHAVFVRDVAAAKLKIYLNGTFDSQVAITGDADYGGDKAIVMGHRNNAGGLHWEGLLDDVIVLGRPLSSNEVAGLYQFQKDFHR